MVTITSAACTISPVQGLGNLPEMSMPRSAMTAMAAGLISPCGSDPPDHATVPPPAKWLKQPGAIWDRPALWLHRNNTTSISLCELLLTLARACSCCRAKRSASSGRKSRIVAWAASFSYDSYTNRRTVSASKLSANSLSNCAAQLSSARRTSRDNSTCVSGPVAASYVIAPIVSGMSPRVNPRIRRR